MSRNPHTRRATAAGSLRPGSAAPAPFSPRSHRRVGPARLPALLLPLLVLACAAHAPASWRRALDYPALPAPTVTVRLLETDRPIVVTSPAPFLVRLYGRNNTFGRVVSASQVTLSLYGEDMIFSGGPGGALDIGIDQVSLVPVDSSAFLEIDGRAWRGALEIAAGSRVPVMPSPRSMTVFNVVGVEDYLKGVVPAEIGGAGEDVAEAVKAQAVAARTYAASKRGQYPGWGYDLEATVQDQVYRGVSGEDPAVTRAIAETRGYVLTHGGTPIDAYFHANCGGMTAFVERVWPEKPARPYLVPVRDPWCAGAPNHDWRTSWDRASLEANLAVYLDTIPGFPETEFGTLRNLQVRQRSPSGRIEALAVTTDTGAWEIGRDRIRWALRRGGDPRRILPSARFDLDIERDAEGGITRVTAEGTGNGHGVGMCQTGAIGMARAGRSWREILAIYYPGVTLERWPAP